jgi:hypothetical protein
VSDTATRLAILEERDVTRRLRRVVDEVASLLLATPRRGGAASA